MRKAIIHIGANKTGSTTLQRALFSKCSEIDYVGEDCHNYSEIEQSLDSLVNDDDDHYRNDDVAALFGLLKENSADRTIVFSNEDIMRSRVPAQCANRLFKMLPQAHVLMVIRNQLTAIPSWYLNHGAYLKNVPRRYWRKYVPFEDWMNHCIDFMKYSPLDGFFFNRYISMYEKLFGVNKIHILMYEDLLHHPDAFFAQLGEVLAVDPGKCRRLVSGRWERPGKSAREMNLDQMFRAIGFNGIPGSMKRFPVIGNVLNRYLSGGRRGVFRLTPYWQEKIASIYRSDNRALMSRYRLPLERYGYPL